MNPDAHTSPPPPPLLPYASPIRPAENSSANTFRLGPQLIVSGGTTLPPLCVLCGNSGEGLPIALTLTWDESFKFTRVSHFKLRTKAVIHLFLCQPHRTRWANARRRGIIATAISVLFLASGAFLAVYSESSDIPENTSTGITLMIAGFAAIIISLFYFALSTRTLSCAQIRENYLYLDGASEKFLDNLPPLH